MRALRRMWTVGGVAGVLLATMAASPAAAERSDRTSLATCTFSTEFRLDPGVSTSPSTFTFESIEDARITCVGKVNGSAVTGTGYYSESGQINGGTCAEGTGTGTAEGRIPTAAGWQTVKVKFDLRYVGLEGYETGDNILAAFQYTPLTGDCLTTPLTKFRLTQVQTLRT